MYICLGIKLLFEKCIYGIKKTSYHTRQIILMDWKDWTVFVLKHHSSS